MVMDPIRLGAYWNHREGNAYRVTGFPDVGMVKIPGGGWLKGPWVQYASGEDLYMRTRADFLENFTEVKS
jgi:hypothetical protein